MDSRKIKFRVWDGEKFLMSSTSRKSDAENISLKIEGGILPIHGGRSNYHNNLSVQQFTGLTDKNGKEIYEGDILKYTFDGDSYPEEAVDKVFICEWDQNHAWFVFREHDDDISDAYFWLVIRGYCEVIGNIFETPELLKQ